MKKKKLIGIITAFTIAAASLSAYGGSSNTEASSASSSASESVSVESSVDASPSDSNSKLTDADSADQQMDAAASEIDYSGDPWNNVSVTDALYESKPALEDDFYAYTNYEWLTTTEFSTYFYSEIADTTQLYSSVYTTIMNEEDTDNTIEQVRTMFNQAMDLDTLSEQGLSTIQPYLDQIDSASSIEELNTVISDESFLFDIYIDPNYTNTGLDGINTYSILPIFAFAEEYDGARNYRIVNDTSSVDELNSNQEIMNTFNATINSLAILGVDDPDYSLATDLLLFEMSYAKYAPYSSWVNDIEWGTVDQYTSTYTLDELQTMFGDFPIKEILASRGQDNCENYVVTCPEWIDTFAKLYTDDNLEILKTSMKLMVYNEAMPFIDPALNNTGVAAEDVQNALTAVTNKSTFGMYLASRYVYDYLGQESIDKLTEVTDNMLNSYKDIIQNCEWMDESTKSGALAKLENMRMNILVPEGGYIDFSDISLTGDTLIDNYLIAKKYIINAENEDIGTPTLSVTAWHAYTPLTANAFYDPESNSINIFPGIINESVFSSSMTDEEIYSRIGNAIAHEIGHCLDYSGSQYDYNARPANWFSEDDLNTFLEKNQAFSDYYSSITIVNGINCDGEAVKTEAVADYSGLDAVLNYVEDIDGWDYEAFFESYAEFWGTYLSSYEIELMVLQSDTHPASYLRSNVNLQMFDKFYETYDIAEGDNMYLPEDERLTLW